MVQSLRIVLLGWVAQSVLVGALLVVGGCGESTEGGATGTAGAGGAGGMAGDAGAGGVGGSVLCAEADCADGNACTDNLCDPADGSCSNPALTDGVSCSAGENAGRCSSGVCVGLCAEADCNDNRECTEDLCDWADGTCNSVHRPDGSACDFGGLPGRCASGVCMDAALCGLVDCGDGNDCTEDVCNPANAACTNPDKVDGAFCETDGNPGLCGAGRCQELCEFVSCDDGNQCTVDTCDPSNGSCPNPDAADDTPCDYGDNPGKCSAGLCVGLCAGVVCNDHEQCTLDACDPSTGSCTHSGRPDRTSCDFGREPGECVAGVCSRRRAWSPPTFAIHTIDSVEDLVVNTDGDYAAIEREEGVRTEPPLDPYHCLWTYPYVARLACGGFGHHSSAIVGHHVGIDGDGHAIVTWEMYEGHTGSVVSTSSYADGWTTEWFDGGYWRARHQLAVARNGDALVAWEALSNSGTTSVWSTRFTRAGGWETEEVLSPVYADSSLNALNTTVALGPEGDGLVLWNDRLGEIWSRRFTTTDRWQGVESVGSGSARQCSLALDSEGVATVLCLGWSRRSTRSQPWEEAVSTEAGGQLGADELGNVVAVWAQDEQLWSSRFTPIGGWDEPERIGAGGSDAHLSVAPQGIAMVVWSAADGLWWNRFTPSGGWRGAGPIDGTDSAYLPHVAVGADGNAELVWARSNEIWSSDYR